MSNKAKDYLKLTTSVVAVGLLFIGIYFKFTPKKNPRSLASTSAIAEITDDMRRAILYLEKTQVQETVGYDRFRGEWPSYMMNDRRVFKLGPKGKFAYDSNNFTVTLTHNILAETYLQYPEFTSIPPMLGKAMEDIMNFYSDGTFNFWHLLPKTDELKKIVAEKYRDVLVRRPNHYELKGEFLNIESNVSNDSDDTAVSYIALHLYEKVAAMNPDLPPVPIKASSIGGYFSAYRDMNRTKQNPYNLLIGNFKNTGAFLTWLSPEVLHFTTAPFAITWENTGIALGPNDLDCIVNSNTLNALAQYNEPKTPGYEDACRFIENAAARGLSRTCGMYYPCFFHLHYVVSKAYQAGATCLKNAGDILLKELRDQQLSDGSWPGSAHAEPMQATLYALNGLLGLGDMSGPDFDRATRGIQFIRSHGIQGKDGTLSWPQGTFFGGGRLLIRNLIWRSQPFSTALGLNALTQYRAILEAKEKLQQEEHPSF